MAMVYSIRDWDKHFEIAQSRKIEGPLAWVALPTKHDGKSFRRLMLMPNGQLIYCAWVLLVQIAAKCPTRGVLQDTDGPLTVEDFFIKTGCPTTVFELALTTLCSKEIGWMKATQLVDERESNGSGLPTQDKQTRQDKPTNQPPYPPKPNDAAPNAVPQAGGLAGNSCALTWEAVEQRLASAGVVQWSQAAANAKAAGSSPQHCHWLLDFAAQHGKGPGAIFDRFKIASPQLGINSGWPNTDRPDTSAEKRAKREADKRAQRAADDAEQAAWKLIKSGRAAGKTDEEIKAECDAASLPWPNPAKVDKPKARAV